MTADDAWFSVQNLRVELTSGTAIVEDFTLELGRGEIVGLVGESGSGKTSSALALLGYERQGVRISAQRCNWPELALRLPRAPATGASG